MLKNFRARMRKHVLSSLTTENEKFIYFCFIERDEMNRIYVPF